MYVVINFLQYINKSIIYHLPHVSSQISFSLAPLVLQYELHDF